MMMLLTRGERAWHKDDILPQRPVPGHNLDHHQSINDVITIGINVVSVKINVVSVIINVVYISISNLIGIAITTLPTGLQTLPSG